MAWSDEELEVKIGLLLRWGVWLAAVVMLAGAAVFLYRYGGGLPDYHAFRRTTPRIRMKDGSELILAAVLMIIATPVARVALAAYAFLRERDWLYFGVSMTVLLLLAFGLSRVQ